MIIILSFAGGAIASGFLNELGSDIYKTIRAKLKDLAQYAETNKRLSFFAVGVEGADMEKLRSISVRDPVKLKGLDFKAMFVWLSASMQKVSASKAGQQVPLQPVGWGEVG